MGLVKIEIDTKDITGMINSLKKVINYFEELQKFANSGLGVNHAKGEKNDTQ